MTPKRLRASSIVIGLSLAAVALLSWSQPWYSVALTGLFHGHPALRVAGDVCAPAVAALALASAAGFAAVAISSGFFRVVVAVLEIAFGAGIAASAWLAIADPESAVRSAVTDVTGLEGAESTGELIGSITATVWPFAALAAGVLLMILGLGVLFTARRWPASGRRYEPVRPQPAEAPDIRQDDASVSEWDELSGGSDPTSR